jgi:hypothetical protein
MTKNDDLKRTWKKKVIAYLRALTCPQTSQIQNIYQIVKNRFLPNAALCPLLHEYAQGCI